MFDRLTIALAILTLASHTRAVEQQEYQVRENLGQHWQHELVHWPLNKTQGPQKLIVNGVEAPCQRHTVPPLVATPLNGTGIYALLDLKPQASVTVLQQAGAAAQTNAAVTIEQTSTGIVLANEHLAVRLVADGTATKGDGLPPGPIQGIRLGKGDWLGHSRLHHVGPVGSWHSEILARGPLFVEAEVRYQWPKGTTDLPAQGYRCRVRVVAGESIVHISERFNIDSTDAHCEYVLSNYKADTWQGEWQKSADHTIEITTQELTAKTRAYVPAWTWYSDRRSVASAWFVAWHQKQDVPVFGAFTTFPQAWVRRAFNDTSGPRRKPSGLRVRSVEGGLTMRVPLAGMGTHTYCLYLASKPRHFEATPSGIAEAKRRASDIPLQRVKDWVLDWPIDTPHPHLFFEADERPAIRARVAALPSFAPLTKGEPENCTFLEDLTAYYLLSQDHQVLPRLLHSPEPITTARNSMQEKGLLWQLRARLHEMVAGNGINPAGINNMMWLADHLLFRIVTADVLLGDARVSDKDKAEIRRALATIAYQMERPEMVPARDSGYQVGMPNFINPYYGTLGLIGALLPEHPHAARWMDRCRDELVANMHWQGREDGAWFESYYYQERTMRGLVPAAVALARKGRSGVLNHPAVIGAFRGQIAQLTPVDPRVGKRCYPPVGDGTYYVPKLNVIWAAHAMANINPQLASEMVWSWQQQDRPTHWLRLSSARDIYIPLLVDGAAVARAPMLPSQHFSGAAVILRSRYNRPTESYFHLRAADFARSHFQDDQLSFHWYAKGAPLCLDWGYYGIRRHRPAPMHNRTVLTGEDKDDLGHIEQAVLLANCDYVKTRNGSGTRCRELLYVRGDDVDEPEYIVMRDRLARGGSWSLWTLANGVSFEMDGLSLADFPAATLADYKRLLAMKDGFAAEIPDQEATGDDFALDEASEGASRPTNTNIDLAELRKNIAQLRLPFLPTAHDGTLPPFAVPLRGQTVSYSGRFGVDLDVHILSPVDRVEMGAEQWRAPYGGPQSYVHTPPYKGEHQKLLRLHRKDAGDFLTVLYPRSQGQEEAAKVTLWGADGVHLVRSDGSEHWVWLAPSEAASLARDGMAAKGAAFFNGRDANGQHRLVLTTGQWAQTPWLKFTADAAGSFVLTETKNGLTGTFVGPSCNVELAHDRLSAASVLYVDGQKTPCQVAAGTASFRLPAGGGRVDIVAN